MYDSGHTTYSLHEPEHIDAESARFFLHDAQQPMIGIVSPCRRALHGRRSLLPRPTSGSRTKTSSPALKRVTCPPMASTIPAASYPILYGNLDVASQVRWCLDQAETGECSRGACSPFRYGQFECASCLLHIHWVDAGREDSNHDIRLATDHRSRQLGQLIARRVCECWRSNGQHVCSHGDT